jgi:hypothetical protein
MGIFEGVAARAAEHRAIMEAGCHGEVCRELGRASVELYELVGSETRHSTIPVSMDGMPCLLEQTDKKPRHVWKTSLEVIEGHSYVM